MECLSLKAHAVLKYRRNLYPIKFVVSLAHFPIDYAKWFARVLSISTINQFQIYFIHKANMIIVFSVNSPYLAPVSVCKVIQWCHDLD